MNRLIASLSLVTPAFLGGADQGAQEIRLTAFKSALRWWWRALQWAHTDSTDPLKARNDLWHREMALFGSAAREDDGRMAGGQGAFLMRLDGASQSTWHAECAETWMPRQQGKDTKPAQTSGRAYLLGQGLWQNGKFAPNRTALPPSKFTLEFLFKPAKGLNTGANTGQEVVQIAQSLWLLCHFGGIGARSRRGWGSVVLDDAMHWDGIDVNGQIPLPARSPQEMSQTLLSLLPKNMPTELPPFTAFSARTLINGRQFSNMEAPNALEAIGNDFLVWRKDISKLDAPLVKNFAKKIHPGALPKRAIFGLPHNYFLINGDDNGKEVSVTLAPSNTLDTGARRASPLLMHMHRWDASPSAACSAIYSLMPAIFLSPGEKVRYDRVTQPGSRLQLTVTPGAEEQLWEPANRFMECLKDGFNIYPSFSKLGMSK